MPSLQGSLPPELSNNVVRLYRECFRRAKLIDTQQNSPKLVVGIVRDLFKKNINERDPERIQELKDKAARGIINHMTYESEKQAGHEVGQTS